MRERASAKTTVPRFFGAALGALGMLSIGFAAASTIDVGVVAAVHQAAHSRLPLEDERVMKIGNRVFFDQSLRTGQTGRAQLLLLDRSAVTVAANSELIIDRFVYDPGKSLGGTEMTLSQGLMRYVGGAISKTGNVHVHTPVGNIGIRGGIALIEVLSEDAVDVTLIYGDGIQGQLLDGRRFTIRRPNYAVRMTRGGGPFAPRPRIGRNVRDQLARLDGRPRAPGDRMSPRGPRPPATAGMGRPKPAHGGGPRRMPPRPRGADGPAIPKRPASADKGMPAHAALAAFEVVHAVTDADQRSELEARFMQLGAPTIDLPTAGRATYLGSTMGMIGTPGAALLTPASGAFSLTTDYATGASMGFINLGPERFDAIGRHTPGAPLISLDYMRGANVVGAGAGAFFGPGGAAVGVTIDIDDGRGLRATGTATGVK